MPSGAWSDAEKRFRKMAPPVVAMSDARSTSDRMDSCHRAELPIAGEFQKNMVSAMASLGTGCADAADGEEPRKMELEVKIGLGLLTLAGAALAIGMTSPENRIPYAIHIVLVNGLAYLVANMT
jgi:hypothetical protein